MTKNNKKIFKIKIPIIVIITVTLLTSGCRTFVQKRTEFPANDKKLHYNTGYTIGTISLPIVPLGLMGGVIAGGGKELYDSLGFGTPEWKDFTFTTKGSWDGYLHTWERSFYGFKETKQAEKK
jgi:hypothetical protein